MTQRGWTNVPFVIATANQKGGTGKSSCVAHSAGLLALAGHRVLTIDLDPQGNLVEAFGLISTPADDGGAALAAALFEGSPLKPLPTSHAKAARPGLFTVSGGPELKEVYVRMLRTFDPPATVDNTALARSAAFWLRTSLDFVCDDFDVVFIDCPPGIEELQVLAFTAADYAWFPVGADLSERKGVRLIAKVFSEVRTEYNPELELVGIVPMRVKRSQERTELANLRARLADDFGGDTSIVFDAWVAEAAAAALQARARGLLVHELDDQRALAEASRLADLKAGRRGSTASVASTASSLASDYTDVTVELLQRINAFEAAKQDLDTTVDMEEVGA